MQRLPVERIEPDAWQGGGLAVGAPAAVFNLELKESLAEGWLPGTTACLPPG